MKDIRAAHMQTQVIHAGAPDDQHGAVVVPIYQVSTFAFDNADQGAELFAGKRQGYIYTRLRNPTVQAVEDAVAVLEGGFKGLACASGMAAINTALSAHLRQGDHVLCSNAVYGPTETLLSAIFQRFGVEADFIDMTDPATVKAHMRSNTRVVYFETPGNPTLAIIDIEKVSEIAHAASAKVIVDNTFAGPVLQKPFDLGADVIVHSMTKSLNGHSDVVAGIVIVRDEEAFARCRKELNTLGGTMDPHQAFLVHRGIKTLALRVERQSENAAKVAAFLEQHPAVARVWYPGLESHPQHELAKRQMRLPGAMITLELKGGLEAGKGLMDKVSLFTLAVSLGGVESLIQHPASMTHAGMAPETRRQAGITDGLVRISVGIEHVDDMIDDLQHALA